MRKLFSIIIISVFLYNIGGYYLWFRILQYEQKDEIEQEIRKDLKDEDLSLIVVPVNNQSGICWTERDKEFRYKGEMYDVVKTKSVGGKKYYYCINDTKEKQLIESFSKNHNSKKDATKIIKTALEYKYFTQNFSFTDNNQTSDFIYATIDLIYESNTIEVISPPPNLV